MEPIISVKNLKKSYGEQIVLDGLTFEVEKGAIFALLGENGAGKTTTVRILSTLMQQDEGTATIAGYDSIKEALSVRKVISLTGQYAAVDDLLTGKENLEMMAKLNHLSRDRIRHRSKELLQQFGLMDAANKPVKTYSGGMRRRLDIAISLLKIPKVLFLDEPTTGLDPRSRRNMWTMIRELADKGTTIFLTTQYLEEADQLADRIVVINEGEIVADGTASELKQLISQEKMVLSFFEEADYYNALALMEAVGDAEELKLEVSADGNPENLRQLLNKLQKHGIIPKKVNFREPTLDDVFMQITGRMKKGVKNI
ncbi:ATP-binding cassette domain-containing protein [Niallia sp. NCCP-28]|uniref:ATP-binding cassette domain-containing protein n=1 Tax=Niallia sp. NCCP-28 TaxID=2934712 RepID=UPI00208B4232|nr:ATP-binding cassette domain-containing protein [Niallia sp. NCCP-28]GKU81919.1 daunorubicin resistance protein DrrA family ABC transporter ATP-binding protein [Niallia sp. NCCP-28]